MCPYVLSTSFRHLFNAPSSRLYGEIYLKKSLLNRFLNRFAHSIGRICVRTSSRHRSVISLKFRHLDFTERSMLRSKSLNRFLNREKLISKGLICVRTSYIHRSVISLMIRHLDFTSQRDSYGGEIYLEYC